MGLLIDQLDTLVDTLARLLLQSLLNSFWQGMIIAALVWLLLRMVKSASATTRHAVWMVSLLTIGALPLIALAVMLTTPPVKKEQRTPAVQPIVQPAIHPAVQFAAPASTPEATPAAVEENIVGLNLPVGTVRSKAFADYNLAAEIEGSARFVTLDESIKVTPMATTGSVMTPQWTEPKTFRQKAQSWGADFFTGRIPVVLVCLWMVVCLLMLSRIARSYVSLFRMRRQFGPAPSEQTERVGRLAEIFGIKRQVRVFTSQQVSMPMTVGSFRPVIILPPDLARSLSTAEFESVIAHELAHIKRWDYLTNLLQRLVQSYLFFHPAVWSIGKHLVIERELACDDWAVKTCEPRRYANCLTKLVELLSESKPFAAAAGILFGKHVISRRVEMILNRDRNATTAVSKPALVYAIGMAVVFVCVCSLISPVIAVPQAQNRERSLRRKESKSANGTQPKSQDVTPTPLQPELPPELSIDVPELPEPPEAPEVVDAPQAPAPPEVAVIEIGDDLFPPLEVHATPMPALAPGRTIGAVPAAPFAQSPVATTTIQSPRPAPAPAAMPAVIAGWDQDDKSKTPAISETELLGVLTEVVKRDSDPAVRNEALQGIYRMRSDAAVNALIQLYDGAGDVKVKSEIIGYLIRRNGDNSKAIAKLMTIAKSDQNEELRSRAIRYLAAVKGDEGANNLIQIYDGLQDSKMKQTVIRYLAYNKSRKAIDKLIQIAKNDSDPAIRQSAIRSLYGVDGRLYLEMVDKARPKIGMVGDGWKIEDLDQLRLDSKKFAEDFQLQNLEFNLKNLENNFQFELSPEFKREIEEKEKSKLKRKTQSDVTPTPKVKSAKSGAAL